MGPAKTRGFYSGVSSRLKPFNIALDRCPTCGAAIEHDKLIFDEQSAVIVREGKVLRLSVSMARMFGELWKAFPKGVTNDHLKFNEYAARGREEPNDDTLSVLLSNHRTGLRNIGIEVDRVTIDGVYGRRLRFIQPDAPTRKAKTIYPRGRRAVVVLAFAAATAFAAPAIPATPAHALNLTINFQTTTDWWGPDGVHHKVVTDNIKQVPVGSYDTMHACQKNGAFYMARAQNSQGLIKSFTCR